MAHVVGIKAAGQYRRISLGNLPGNDPVGDRSCPATGILRECIYGYSSEH